MYIRDVRYDTSGSAFLLVSLISFAFPFKFLFLYLFLFLLSFSFFYFLFPAPMQPLLLVSRFWLPVSEDSLIRYDSVFRVPCSMPLPMLLLVSFTPSSVVAFARHIHLQVLFVRRLSSSLSVVVVLCGS